MILQDLKSEMPPACDSVTKAGDALLKATHQLKQQPFSSKVRYNLVDSARNILEGTMKVNLTLNFIFYIVLYRKMRGIVGCNDLFTKL